jgi:hypothetical protein
MERIARIDVADKNIDSSNKKLLCLLFLFFGVFHEIWWNNIGRKELHESPKFIDRTILIVAYIKRN